MISFFDPEKKNTQERVNQTINTRNCVPNHQNRKRLIIMYFSPDAIRIFLIFTRMILYDATTKQSKNKIAKFCCTDPAYLPCRKTSTDPTNTKAEVVVDPKAQR